VATLTGITFTDGHAHITASQYEGDGGGIDVVSGRVDLVDSTVTGNTADSAGGGISVTNGELDIDSSTISDNAAGWGRGPL
jgi:hypothetical protein